MQPRALALALALSLAVTGCGYVESAKQKVGLAYTPEQIKANQEAEQKQRELDRQRQEQERQQQERDAKERLATLRTADKQVEDWAQRLDGDGKSPFQTFEGVTEPDPWGNLIRVSYGKRGYDDEMEVRSAGPDGQVGTSDDPQRHRYRTSTLAAVRTWIDAVPAWAVSTPAGWATTLWTVSAPIGLVGTTVKGKHKRKKHPVVSGTVIAAISPIILIGTLAMLGVGVLASVLGDGDGDGFYGFDFFDLDLDF